MAEPELSVFMPARNERPTISQNIRVLRNALEKGRINHAVVVVDGSTDGTREIVFREVGLNAEQMKRIAAKKRATVVLENGIILINHSEPEGKGRCFMEAVFTLNGRTPHFKSPRSVLVNIDADALDLSSEKITGLAKELRKKGEPMLLGTHMEKSKTAKYPIPAGRSSTGFRAISARALKPMLKMEEKWVRVLPRRFGMDYALNLLVYRGSRWSTKPAESGKKSIREWPVPMSGIDLSHSQPGKHTSEVEQNLQRQEVGRRYRGEKTTNDSPHELAFREKFARRRVK